MWREVQYLQDGKKPPLPSALLICIPRVRRRREGGGRPGKRLQWCKHKREEILDQGRRKDEKGAKIGQIQWEDGQWFVAYHRY